MTRLKIFISSVQSEFSNERLMLYDYINTDALLGRFFELFIFEKLPASDSNASTAYLKQVSQSEVYLGIFGKEYGYKNKDGISPTEMEFNLAASEHKTRLIFISQAAERHPKEQELIRKAEDVVVRKKFSLPSELKTSVYILWRAEMNLGEASGHVTPQATDQVTDQVKRLVLLMEKEYSRQELMQLLDLKHGQTFRDNYLNPALKYEYIEMTLPDSPNSPTQKYRLTIRGKVLQEKLKDR